MPTPEHTPKALIIVDAQKGFINHKTQRCIPKIHDHIASEKYNLIAATQFINPEQSPYRTRLNWHNMRPEDTENTALDPIVEENADIIVEKPGYASNIEPIIEKLHAKDTIDVTVCGLETDACVLAVAFALFNNNFHVSVDLDACATSADPEIEKGGEAILARSLGKEHVYRTSTH